MFTISELKQLIEALDQSTVNELSLEQEGQKLKLKKQMTSSMAPSQQPIVYQASPEPQSVPIQTQQEEEAADLNISEPAYDYVLKSPMVGTFYLQASPESEPYVRVGDVIGQNTTLCTIEAMKLFNEIEAEIDGEIVEILAENGELVEYNQPLFGIKTK